MWSTQPTTGAPYHRGSSVVEKWIATLVAEGKGKKDKKKEKKVEVKMKMRMKKKKTKAIEGGKKKKQKHRQPNHDYHTHYRAHVQVPKPLALGGELRRYFSPLERESLRNSLLSLPFESPDLEGLDLGEDGSGKKDGKKVEGQQIEWVDSRQWERREKEKEKKPLCALAGTEGTSCLGNHEPFWRVPRS